MPVEDITVTEFLNASALTAINGADKPRFRHLLAELERFPKTRQRLVFEMLHEALRLVDHDQEPLDMQTWIWGWSDTVDEAKIPEFLDLLERLTVKYSENLHRIEFCEPELTMPALLGAIRNKSSARLQTLWKSLEHRAGDTRRRHILKEIQS